MKGKSLRKEGAVTTSGLNQAASDCVACEVDAVAHAELSEEVRAVAFDGFDAENVGLADGGLHPAPRPLRDRRVRKLSRAR